MTKARDLANASTALSAVSATELGYVDGVTSAIQTQMDAKLATATATSTYIPKTLTTTTGDIIYASAANTPARLGIGTTDQVLKVTAGVPAWATPTAGGTANWSLLNAGGTALTGAQTITVSGISGANQVMIVFVSASNGQAGTALGIRLNTDTGTNYNSYGTYVYSPFAHVVGGTSQNVTTTNGTYIGIGSLSGSAGSAASGYCLLSGTNAAGVKPFQAVAGFTRDGNDSQANNIIGGVYLGTSTISSISMYSPSSNFDAGTVYVYTTA